jgi:protein O-GlcNAc transferase
MGVPVLTLLGTRHAARVGASLLTQIGLQNLIAPTLDNYIHRATTLASDREPLATIRSTLRMRMESSPLCDAPGFAREMESAYRAMWRDWCKS